MSGNIHDTNVMKIRILISDFINELEETIEKGDDIVDYEDMFKEKYKYIIETSENLYKMIYDQYKISVFDKKFFLKNIETMLQAIERIQQAKVTQYDASKQIGEMLAGHYIPQLKK
jgi:hypothetical protein